MKKIDWCRIVILGVCLSAMNLMAADDGGKADLSRGIRYLYGRGVKKDPVEAVKWIRKAAEQGNANAQKMLGNCYLFGNGVKKDAATAQEWYRKAVKQYREAAAKGDVQAQFNLGLAYHVGNGVARDPAEAEKWYLKAAEQGHKMAPKALQALRRSAQSAPTAPTAPTAQPAQPAQTAPTAQPADEPGKEENVQGMRYFEGLDVRKDFGEAVKWFRKAAEKGNRFGQSNLAYCYESGQGVEKNLAEAAKWYRMAAEQGNADAQCALGRLYRNGEGVEKNPEEAVKWFRKSAEQGDKDGQSWLAACYENGEGVAKDYAEAAKWYRKAADQGVKYAQEALARLSKKQAEAAKRQAETAPTAQPAQPAQSAQTKTVEAEGFGETIEKALKNARENAVRKVFGEVVDSVTETKNEELVESTIAASSGFVVSSRVIGRPKYDAQNKYYVVKTETVVSTEQMKAQINRFRKSTVKVDIQSQLKAADNAKQQEENAKKILLHLAYETPKVLRLKGYNVNVEKNLSIDLQFSYDREQLMQMFNQAAAVLRANGYEMYAKINKTGLDHGCLSKPVASGSTIVIGDYAYYNKNSKLYAVSYDDRSSYNVWQFLPDFYVSVHLLNTKSNVIGSWELFKTKRKRLKVFLSTSDDNRMGGVILLGEDDFCSAFNMNTRLLSEISGEDLKQLSKVIVMGTFVNSDKKFQIAEFPLNAQNIYEQAESKYDRAKQFASLVLKFHRDYYKFYQPKVEGFKYDRDTDAAEIKVKFSFDRRGFVYSARELGQKLEALGITLEKKHREDGRAYFLRVTMDDLWEAFIPDKERVVFNILKKEIAKYRYSLIIKFKDKEGNLLQQFDEPLSNHIFGHYHDDFYSIDVNYQMRLFKNMYYRSRRGHKIKFDIPEDVKKVDSVECYIEERIVK